MLPESKHICTEFQLLFAQLYRTRVRLEVDLNFTSKFDGMLQFWVKDMQFSEMQIGTEYTHGALDSCTREICTRLNGLPFNIYMHVLVLFVELWRDIYCK